MVKNFNESGITPAVIEKIKKVKILLTDNDGVLTDTGVYYGPEGEVFKKFSIRDGMGVERLRTLCGIETGIITGELSESVRKRAEKLKLQHLYLGIKDKKAVFSDIVAKTGYSYDEIAYIGDDYNDLEVIELAGLTASPGDALPFIRSKVDYVCDNYGGHGAVREFAELIIYYKTSEKGI
ncbi:MAG: HAD hydrolase family protein [Ignavibacteriaceae bacterium]|nr:HAD hydrolase family protein [Ignavibacteriaceae bacterium]